MAEPWFVVLLLPVGVVVAAGLVAGGHALLTGAGPATPLVETARLLVGRTRRTARDDVGLARLGTTLLPVAAVLAAAVVPLGARPLVDLDVGVVWFNAMEVLAWVAVWAAGWAANSALALAGGYRMIVLGLAYELPHMLALVAPAIGAGSLRVPDVAAAQHDLWFAPWMPAAFGVYLLSTLATAFWGPFDAPLGHDLAGGAAAEHAGVDRLLLEAGRWMLLTVAAALAVPLFLGGGAPVLRLDAPPAVWTAIKTVAVLAVLLLAGRTLPRLRMERFATFSWLVLVPLGIAQALVVAIVVVLR